MNAPLRVQEEGIDAMAGRQIADIVCRHAIQPTDAVSAGNGNLGAPAQVVDAATCEQSLKLGADVAEVRRSGRCRRVRRDSSPEVSSTS